MKLTWKLNLLLVLVIGSGGWYLWGNQGDAVTNAKPRGTNIIAFGDSLTAGYGLPQGQGYVEQLSQRLGITILNKGTPGIDTTGALGRLEEDVLNADPRIVLVFLGGNDMLQRRSEDVTFGNLEQIITRIQDRGALVILIGLDGFILSPNYNQKFRDLAKKTGCPLIPGAMNGIVGHADLMRDQIHPNQKGYALIADRIEPVLREMMNDE